MLIYNFVYKSQKEHNHCCHGTISNLILVLMSSLLRFHRKDVLDLQWSADGSFLISGSVDNSCIVWDVNKGKIKEDLT